jgi:hypothetical protein
MSSKLLVQHDGPTDRARHWDQPQGLGWQLWRRAHATALSSKQLRRNAQHVRLFPLMRHSLLADVHQRWGIGQSSAVSRFYADLPFFRGRAPFFYAGASPEQSSSPHQWLRRSVDAHSVSSLTSMAHLPRALRPSQAMTTEGTAQRLSMAGAALMRRGRDMPNPDPALRLPLNRPRSNSFGNPAGIAPDSDDGASSDVGPFSKPDGQQSEQQVVLRSTSVPDSIKAKSDIRTSRLRAASPEAQQNELVGSLLRHRDVPVLRNLMLQGGVEQNVQYPLLNGKSKLSSSVMRQRSGGTPRSSSPSGIQHVETPRYVVNPDKPILGITATAAGEDPGSVQRAVSSFSGLTGTWPGALVSPPFLRRFHGQSERGQQTSAVMLRDAAPDLPLVHPLRPEDQYSLAARQHANGSIMQTSPQPAATTTGSAEMLTSIGNGQGPAIAETQTRSSQAQIDLDELVEKTWQKLMDKLTIEQERRGRMQWL